MIDASLLSSKWFTNNSVRTIYETVGVGTATVSDEIRIAVDKSCGVIASAQVVTLSSTDFDVSIREKSGITPPSVYEILKREDNNLNWGESGIVVPFNNADSSSYLYMKITNTDVTNSTGTVTLALHIMF
jgi:hypothetical protein